jgi:UDP-N-acetylmuramoyl-L-alanyl-D-glutamate--2,6-diaminopimelate ligase
MRPMTFLEILGRRGAENATDAAAPSAGGGTPPLAEAVREVWDVQGDSEIYGVEYDSRRVRPGFCFVAMKGETTDGNRFIDAAVANGAVAVVTDSKDAAPRAGVAWARVASGRRALALLSSRFHGWPAQQLGLTGVTGTNGKTTTTFLLESILNAAGRKTVLVGTIEYHVAGEVVASPHTTPEASDLNKLFAKGVREGAHEAVMEVSSHALAQERVYGFQFDVAAFTNLTRDHLDYHRDFEDYFRAKSRLFEGCGSEPPESVVINHDDEFGRRLIESSRARGREVLTYGLQDAAFHARNIELSARGTRFDMVTPLGQRRIQSALIGKVNVYNILAAAAAAHARGCSLDEISAGVAALKRVPGRFELVDCGQPFTVAVDYAHTDDALRNLTAVAREFVGRGRVITLFGCGGDRDRRKRPLMGHAAGEGSDFVVVTSDNPRSEDPQAIINEALVGVQRSGVQYAVEPDRRAAIALAVAKAKSGDIVLLAGKGHEKVQITRQGTAPFDDVQVAREALHAAGYAHEPAMRSAR